MANGYKAGVSVLRGPGNNVNDTGNETLDGYVAMLNKEANDRSDAGGDDD